MEPESTEQQEPGPSLYNFDLLTPDGVERVVALLPILDESIVKAVYQECFPGYPIDNISPRVARVELRGFFMDFLDGSTTPETASTTDDSSEDEDPEGSLDAGGEEGADGEEGAGAPEPSDDEAQDPEGSPSSEGEGETEQAEAAPDGDDA